MNQGGPPGPRRGGGRGGTPGGCPTHDPSRLFESCASLSATPFRSFKPSLPSFRTSLTPDLHDSHAGRSCAEHAFVIVRMYCSQSRAGSLSENLSHDPPVRARGEDCRHAAVPSPPVTRESRPNNSPSLPPDPWLQSFACTPRDGSPSIPKPGRGDTG